MKIRGISALIATSAVALACAMPAHAGNWVLTSSYTGSSLPGSWGSQWVNTNTSSAYSFQVVFDNGSGGESGSYTYTGSIQWVGSGPQPAYVTLSETGGANADALYTATATQSANDGLGDASTTSVDYNPYANVVTNSSGSHTTQVSIPVGGTYTFTRTLSASSRGGSINDCSVAYSISIQ
jgi:hypothetical protein